MLSVTQKQPAEHISAAQLSGFIISSHLADIKLISNNNVFQQQLNYHLIGIRYF